MGRDKGLLEYHGSPQVLWLTRLLAGFCEAVYVSVNAEQRTIDPYATLPTLVDRTPDQGPATGLLSAWEAIPRTAWLAVAVDLPFVDEATLAKLLAGRSPGSLATAFRHPTGVPEPVCTVWEPSAQAVLAERVAAGERSLRRVLEAGPTVELPPPAPGVLMSVNTPNKYREALAILAAGGSEAPC